MGVSDSGAEPPENFASHSGDHTLPGKSQNLHCAAPIDVESGSRSFADQSFRSLAEGYAASSAAKLDTFETRALLSLTTSLGSVECTITYNEEGAQSIVAAKELDAIDGCLEEFHPIADSYTERGASECPEDVGTVASDTEPWLDTEESFGGELSNGQRQLLVQETGLPRGAAGENNSRSLGPAGEGKKDRGLWLSLLRRESVKQAYRLASIPLRDLGLFQLLGRHSPRGLFKLPMIAGDVTDDRADGVEEEQGASLLCFTCPLASAALRLSSDRTIGMLVAAWSMLMVI